MVKRRGGVESFRDKAKLPRRAGWKVRVEYEKNEMRNAETMRKYRYGLRLWVQGCGKPFLKRIGVKLPGKYTKTNQHGGECFALPGDINLTGNQAAQILWKCYKHGMTEAQLKVVKKALSYAYQLQGGEPGKNFKTIPGVWLVMHKKKMGPQQHFVIPTKVPRPEDLRFAFTKPWKKESDMSYVEYCQGLLAAWAWGVQGARSKEDMSRIKNGDNHGFDAVDGYAWTSYKGGRSKLAMRKAGTRPWRLWLVCMCPGGQHIRLPEDVEYALDKDGNFYKGLVKISWCTSCPVNAHEFMLRSQWNVSNGDIDELMSWRYARLFRKWKQLGGYGKTNNGDPIDLAFRWFRSQGLAADWDSNSGRKSLAKWLHRLQVPYHEGFQLHGDLEEVWGGYYQKKLPKSGYGERRQSNDAVIATRALRRFATWCGRGIPVQPQLTRCCAPKSIIHIRNSE